MFAELIEPKNDLGRTLPIPGACNRGSIAGWEIFDAMKIDGKQVLVMTLRRPPYW